MHQYLLSNYISGKTSEIHILKAKDDKKNNCVINYKLYDCCYKHTFSYQLLQYWVIFKKLNKEKGEQIANSLVCVFLT